MIPHESGQAVTTHKSGQAVTTHELQAQVIIQLFVVHETTVLQKRKSAVG